jgi:hypothetical protein
MRMYFNDGRLRLYRCTRCGTWLAPWVVTPCLLCRVRFALWRWLRAPPPSRATGEGERDGV